MSTTYAAAGRHRRTKLVLPAPPNDQEKNLYLDRNLFYLATSLVIGAGTLIVSQIEFEAHNQVPWPFVLLTLTFVLYQLTSLPLNFTGRGFDIDAHQLRIRCWLPLWYPSVDVYLPICGEPIEVLRNTWTAVARLMESYCGPISAYVLDDGDDSDAEEMAAEFGYSYWVRPNRGEYKKAGNLRYAFSRTSGEFIIILDADFAPRSDFLAEMLPYMEDATVAIVQSPQYFRTSERQTWVERSAGAIQEVFYRSVQVARDRFGQSICVGTSALYRRAALQPHGGPTLIPYAEDVHTGLDVRRDGWRAIYLPLLLSAGICPDNLDSFVRQQYRWCTGNAGVMFSRRLWSVPMTVPGRLTYMSGFFYYAYTGLLVFFGPITPIILLVFLADHVRLSSFLILLPAVLSGFVLYPLWHHARYGPSVWPLGIARGWAHVFAIWDSARGKTMSWHPSRTPGSSLRRFRYWVTWWSGGLAVAWVALAVWRTVQADTAQFAIILAFGLINLAAVARVVLPGRKAA